MKAAVYRENGGPEVLTIEDVADPVPDVHEVLIETEAISIEGGDLLTRLMLPLPRQPHVVGYASAGTIVAVGEQVTDLQIGQRVTAFGQSGSHATMRAVRADQCWVLSDGVDAVSAACVPVSFGTAYEALFELGGVTKGTTVLLQGAAGGVCLAGLQLAARAGARVIGTGSSHEQLDSLRKFGLDEGIDHRTENVRERILELTNGVGVDVALDPVGGPMTQEVILATRRGGRVMLVGASARERTMIDATLLVLRNQTMCGFMLSDFFHTARVRAYIADLLRQLAHGDFEVVVDRVFPLDDASGAHRRAEERGRIGRVVMVP